MSERYFDHKGNRIQSGRQLQRTPPPHVDVVRHLNFCIEDDEDQVEPQQNLEAGSREQSHPDEKGMFVFNCPETRTETSPEPLYPDSMLRGMKGYQPLPGDLEFLKKMKEEKLIGKLQGDLEEVQRALKKEMAALKQACATWDVAHAELNKFPSCEELAEWVTVVLQMTSPTLDLTDLDAKSLLALVTEKNVLKATDEKRVELACLEKMVEDKRKEEAKDRGQLEKRIASEQLKIHGMMSQVSDLTRELAQEEEAYKVLQMQIKTHREIKEEEAAETTSGELRGRNRRQERKKEKLQDPTNQSKSTRSKRTENQATLKEDRASKSTNETPSATKQTKQKSEDKSVKAAKGPQKKVEEQEVPVQAVRGRRKAPAAAQAAAPAPKNQSKVKPVEARSASRPAAPSRSRRKAAAAPPGAGEEAQNAGLRRSKRIASRS
ncbi:axoneme-associated protein mst101(2) [Hippoglossus stenolepis]|uniref:axoneme-associated protein mst101(2) n=1 Tax=Hippoglossus stenolepis TaxID=195615 RepID=UPI001FAFF8C5|nr:axoneme-associated protein mst101(2) [Hippoglossus stenolepis]